MRLLPCRPTADHRCVLSEHTAAQPCNAPSRRCCQVASGWESEGCACSEEAQAGLGTLLEQLLQLGTEELAFLLGATRIIDAACGVTTPPCQAG